MKIHFISGLPRSGSTLLAALLSQHPAISVTVHSPVMAMINAVFPVFSEGEHASQFSNSEREHIIRGIVEGYHFGRHRQTVIDGNRMWTSKLPLLSAIYPEAKLLCCVRPFGDIVNSLQRAINRHPLQSAIFDHGCTGAQRVESWMGKKGIIGAPAASLIDALAGSFRHRIFVVHYDKLCSQPKEMVEGIQEFLGLPMISPNVEDFGYQNEALDEFIGSPGLHYVHGPVIVPSKEIVIDRSIYDKLNRESVPWMT